MSSVSWYSISISPTGGSSIFSGYFSVDNSTNIIQNFYNANNIGTNILASGPGDHYGADYKYIGGNFTGSGTAITSIPALNSTYSAVEWSLWAAPQNGGNNDLLSYKKNNQWIDLASLNLSFTFTFTLSQDPTTIPIANTCFPAGTPINTDQGVISIENIKPEINTIRNQNIIAITKNITRDKYLICIEKNALGNNIPSEKTIISKNHKLLYKGQMIKANKLLDISSNVYKIKYNEEILYNVLLKDHSKILVNNMICETLNPKHGIAVLHKILKNIKIEDHHKIISFFNNHSIKHNIFK